MKVKDDKDKSENKHRNNENDHHSNDANHKDNKEHVPYSSERQPVVVDAHDVADSAAENVAVKEGKEEAEAKKNKNKGADESVHTGSGACSKMRAKMRCLLRTHFFAAKTWLRILFILLFILAYCLIRFVILGVVILQTLFMLFTGKRNQPIHEFASGLASYAYQIVQYICYISDGKPFPFQSWPKAVSGDAATANNQSDAADTVTR